MTPLTLGLGLFVFTHLLSGTVLPRRLIVTQLSENAYRGVFSLLSLTGVGLMIWGWRHTGTDVLFAPYPLAWKTAPFVVSVAMILVVAAQMPCHLRRVLRHPMLLGVALWSANHLLGGGTLRQTILFGGLLAFSLFELASLFLRGKRAAFVPQAKYDVRAVLIGLGLSVGGILLHPWAMGMPAWYF